MHLESNTHTAVLPATPTVTSGQIAVAPIIVDSAPHIKHGHEPASSKVAAPRLRRHKKS